MTRRKVRYNVKTDSGEQIILRHRWTVAILNELREIDRIKERFLRQFAPSDEYHEHREGLVQGSGLHCLIFSVSSDGVAEDKIIGKFSIFDLTIAKSLA